MFYFIRPDVSRIHESVKLFSLTLYVVEKRMTMAFFVVKLKIIHLLLKFAKVTNHKGK